MQACCSEGSDLFVVVDQFQLRRKVSESSALWTKRDARRAIWNVATVSECVAWQFVSGEDAMVIYM